MHHAAFGEDRQVRRAAAEVHHRHAEFPLVVGQDRLARRQGLKNDADHVQAALEEGVSAEVLSVALYTRFRSRQEHTFAEKILSAMRKGFGGHVELPRAVKTKQGL